MYYSIRLSFLQAHKQTNASQIRTRNISPGKQRGVQGPALPTLSTKDHAGCRNNNKNKNNWSWPGHGEQRGAAGEHLEQLEHLCPRPDL